MEKNKLLNFLGICKKSGKVSFGFESCIDTVKKNKSFLVLFANDLSERTLKKFNEESENFDVETINLNLKIEDLYTILKRNVGIISINDKTLAQKVKKLHSELKEDTIL